MPPRLGRKRLDQEHDAHSAQDGNENNERAPRRHGRVGVCVVEERKPTEEKQIVEDGNQIAEKHGAKPGHNTHEDRHK
jgi:hypothetical protein